MFRKKKKEFEPQYYTSATNMPTYNYRVYNMPIFEKILTFIVAFIIGGAIGYLFYGGIGVDEFGAPTAKTWFFNIFFSTLAGLLFGCFCIPIRKKQIRDKRKKMLKSQFRDMLEAFNSSLGAGKNVVDSFSAVYSDLNLQYEEDAFILKELEIILSGINNNIDIEDLLLDFGERSGIDDIKSFANVFKISYRKGGNIKETIRITHEILSDKMAIEEDIETIVTANKLEQKIMIVMPIGLIAMIKMMSAEFAANFVTPSGLIATTIAIIMFVISYFVGKAILDIKV